MSAFDLPLDQLRAYRPPRSEPDDFDAFWADTLAGSRAARPRHGSTASRRRSGPSTVDDVTFSGFAGQPIKGWLLAPAGATGPLPAVVEYIGYGGGRSLPFEWLEWSSAGLRPLRDGHPRPGQHVEPRRRRRTS